MTTTTFISRNRRAISALVVFLASHTDLLHRSNPSVFLNPTVYTAVFVSLPVSIMLAVPLVFVVAAGEIDLAFPSVFGLAAYAFALVVQAGMVPGWAWGLPSAPVRLPAGSTGCSSRGPSCRPWCPPWA